MGILKKGKDFSPTEQVTSTKLDELVDNASFTNTSETSVAYTGTTGTCLQGGGLEVTSLGQLQIASSGVDNDNILDDTITSNKLSFIEDSVSTTSGKILVADGTTYDAETMSGDATIAAGGALTIGSNKVTPAKTSFLGTVDTTANSTAHMLIKQSDGEYDSKTLTGDVTITQAGVTNVEDDVALGGNPTTTTQSASNNSTRIATTAYVTTGIANALTGSGGIFGTIDQTADSNPKIFSKNSSGDYDSVTPSGDVSMTQAGAFTIADDAVDTAQIADDAVDTAQIADDAITFAKLADATLTSIKEALYPVGYILTTVTDYADSAAVVAAFGGTTWVRFGAGRALVGYNASDTDFDAAEETGGVKEVTLTAAQSGLPSHSHTQRGGGFDGSTGIEAGNKLTDDLGQTGTTGGTDASEAHTNLQPYITVYMWKRTV